MQTIEKDNFIIYCCDYEGEVKDLIINKPKEYRILYDRILDKYFVSEMYNCIHYWIFEVLWENYYYEECPLRKVFNLSLSDYYRAATKRIKVKNINEEKRKLLSNYLTQDDTIEPILYVIMFSLGQVTKGGQYPKEYNYSFGNILAERKIDEEVKLINYLNKYDNIIKKESK